MDYTLPKKKVCGLELPNAEQLTVYQIANLLHSTREHIYHLRQAGELEAFNIAPSRLRGEWRIVRKSLIDFIERRTSGPIVEVDWTATQAPHGLELPRGNHFRLQQVADFLQCSAEHVSNLVDAWELTATNIAVIKASERARFLIQRARFLIPRAGLIYFINTRTEGAH